MLDVDADSAEVIVGHDGEPFETFMDALAYGKVNCSREWHVVAVKVAA